MTFDLFITILGWCTLTVLAVAALIALWLSRHWLFNLGLGIVDAIIDLRSWSAWWLKKSFEHDGGIERDDHYFRQTEGPDLDAQVTIEDRYRRSEGQ